MIMRGLLSRGQGAGPLELGVLPGVAPWDGIVPAATRVSADSMTETTAVRKIDAGLLAGSEHAAPKTPETMT